ncbi:MAG: DUF1554 domain-containing protein [Spirochaetales bacterium]|nr:DUF1554 domain-containing protein [Spirochaetales bacterium]
MKNRERRVRKIRAKVAVSLLTLAFVHCFGNSGAGDRILFGISGENGPVLASTTTNACASEVTITTATIELVEDGDVSRAYSTTSPYYTDTDADGGTSWGFRSVETCIYPAQSFTGTVEIPLSTNTNYSGRLTVQTSFPAAASGNWPGSNQNLPEKLVFASSGVAARQCFTITRVNDALQNTREDPFQVTLETITAADDEKVYLGKNPCDITATVEDDEGPGIRVSNISRIMEEPGAGGDNDAEFLVRLRTNPTADVVIPINDIYDATNANRREGTASPTSLTFTTGNYNVDQAVTITSNDDLEVDGTKTYTVEVQTAQSTDTNYNGLKPRNVVVINNDKSEPGYVYERFDTTGGSTTASAAGTITGFATDEMNNMGSTYSTFTIRLRSKPTADVTLNFTSSNTTISEVQTPSLTFTPSNWNVAQTVTVIGKTDGADGGSGNGNIDYTVSFTTTSTDTTYAGGSAIPRPSFSIRSCDNDNTHEIQPCNFSGSPYGDARGRLSGAEPSATTAIWLITKAAPGSTITVGLSSTDTSEGTVPASVTIDSSNYHRMTTAGTNRIVLTHVDDTALDGSVNWTVTTAAATGGSTYNPFDPLATTTDNEQRYYINRTGSTNEQDTLTATIDICLGAHNAEAITINAVCSGDECGSISPTSVTFDPGTVISGGSPTNASCSSDVNKRTFTVHGADDSFADGSQNFTVDLSVAANTDPVYNGQHPADQTVSNADNEQPGKAIFVTSSSYVGEMTAAGVGGADNFCQTTRPGYAPSGTYKALIVSDSATNRRIATTDGSTNAGQTGWVLTANYHYYRCTASGNDCTDEHRRLFIANSHGLIPAGAMGRDFSTNVADEFWTGMNVNMTAATQSSTPAQNPGDPDYRDNCAGWTYQNAPVNPFPTYYGQTWVYGGSAGTYSSTTNVACTSSKKLICVQQ